MQVAGILPCDPLVYCRYSGYTREAYFSVGLQGIAEQDTQAVRDIIDRTIEEVIECVWLALCNPAPALMLSSRCPHAALTLPSHCPVREPTSPCVWLSLYLIKHVGSLKVVER